MDKPTLSAVASFYVIIPILLILTVVALYLRAQQMSSKQNKQIRWLTVILLLIYLFVYVWLTFLYRSPGVKPRTRLVPFETYGEAFGLFRIKRLGLARAIIFNILLTIPVGLLVPLLFSKHPILTTAGIGLLLAIVTEGLQYITRLGICETDDVIGNFLGCLIGMGVMAAGTRFIHRYMKRQTPKNRGGVEDPFWDRRTLGMRKKNIMEDMKSMLRVIEALLEVAILSLLFYLVWRFWYGENLFPPYYGRGKIVLIGVYAALLLIGFHLNDCFQFGYLKLMDVLISQWVSVFITNFITYFQLSLIANKMISPLPLVVLFVVDIGVTFICTYLFTALYHKFYVPRNMLMIYGQENSLDLKFKMDNREDKYHVTEIISADEPLECLYEAINRHDAVIINDIPADLRNDLIKHCYGGRIRTYTAPKVSDIIMDGAKEITLFDTPLRLIRGRGLTFQQRVIKRTVDILLCLLAMIPFTPIMLIISLAIKIEDHGPVFYKQKRVTRYGHVFEIYKFRSMIVDAEKNNQVIPATGHDPRITKVGRIIRATRLDESAQILNILKGEMSIVGPRPERVEHVKKYCDEIPEFHFREKVKAGLTGYAQVYGKYNTTAYDKLRLDLMYIENYSLRLDIKLMLMTIRILFTPEATEGFEVQKENEKKRKELLKEEEEIGG